MRKYEYIEEGLLDIRNSVFHAKGQFRKLTDAGFRDALNANRRFKGIHQGKRCFVLGSGPSLKDQDLSLLKDEFVICVNQCSRNRQFLDMHPNYYVCVDMNFFRIDEGKEEDNELLRTFRDLSRVDGMECFFPIEYKESFVERFGLQEKLHINYIYGGEFLTENDNREFELSERVPNFGSVVQTAIMIAIYMGFREIYLLGCDNTGIIVTLNSVMKKNNDAFYSYDVSENENKRMEDMVERCGLEGYAMAYYWTVRAYRRLYAYCRRRGIQLVNCSGETAIDSIPREPYLRVLKKDVSGDD